jgi:hypothetical protein
MTLMPPSLTIDWSEVAAIVVAETLATTAIIGFVANAVHDRMWTAALVRNKKTVKGTLEEWFKDDRTRVDASIAKLPLLVDRLEHVEVQLGEIRELTKDVPRMADAIDRLAVTTEKLDRTLDALRSSVDRLEAREEMRQPVVGPSSRRRRGGT